MHLWFYSTNFWRKASLTTTLSVITESYIQVLWNHQGTCDIPHQACHLTSGVENTRSGKHHIEHLVLQNI